MDNKTSSSSTENTTSSNRDQYLKHLNKLSHKISKPVTRKPNFDPPPVPAPNPQNAPLQQLQSSASQPNQHQPPVYNINKNDFRDVVQKLTGSPAHTDRFATPPPIHPPKTQSSRLQRIRPPPLAQLASRPPSLLDGAVSAQPNNNNNNNNSLIPPMGAAAAHFGGVMGRSTAPLSPLPPFPTVHAAAESPVSAYMRYLHNSLSTGDSNPNMNQKQQQHFSGFSPLAPLVSPRWTNLTPPPQPEQNQNENQNQNQQVPQPELGQGMAPSSEAPAPAASSQPQFAMPASPLPFGCLNSPRSQYGLLSPTQLGFPQLPLSPTVPVPSPRWRGF
ncbi:PREDICTED: proline-rich protein 36 [Fragaria vesca subsp. vesca]|uniref:proline-rich protein 36 n=1 Tax=Fragaria vesca subsp. vesca TaxID=101020 RepID=UPI0002C2FF4B|nr:PREDICTED: proline-rich protein 36 [Fragaria vesca subsp. vesca]